MNKLSHQLYVKKQILKPTLKKLNIYKFTMLKYTVLDGVDNQFHQISYQKRNDRSVLLSTFANHIIRTLPLHVIRIFPDVACVKFNPRSNCPQLLLSR